MTCRVMSRQHKRQEQAELCCMLHGSWYMSHLMASKPSLLRTKTGFLTLQRHVELFKAVHRHHRGDDTPAHHATVATHHADRNHQDEPRTTKVTILQIMMFVPLDVNGKCHNVGHHQRAYHHQTQDDIGNQEPIGFATFIIATIDVLEVSLAHPVHEQDEGRGGGGGDGERG